MLFFAVVGVIASIAGICIIAGAVLALLDERLRRK